MRAAIFLSTIAAALMFVLIGRAIRDGSFWHEGSLLFALAWGQVTMADLYVGFSLFSGWVLFREQNLAIAVSFVLLVMTLGNAFAAAYVVVTLVKSRGSWPRFWLGHRALEPEAAR